MIGQMLEVAIHFAMENLTVFPCARKRPLVPGGFKAATLHPKTLYDWWTKWPSAQVGLPTGAVNHLFVLDIDGPEADAFVATMNLPDTFTVETSPGRKQLWFRQPQGITTRSTAGVLAPQLDTRGDGGYTIAPGSIHHETGQPYRALNDLPWAELPDVLIRAVDGGEAASIQAQHIPQGQRHHTLLKLAGGLRARGLAASSVLAVLMAVNERLCVPPLPLAEVEKFAAFVCSKAPGFRGATMETTAQVDLECFANVKPERLRWLWPKRIPLGKLTLFVGDPGQGKSLVSIDVGARISRGRSFHDGAPAEVGEVIFLSAEDDPNDTQQPRLVAAGADLSRVHRVKAVKVSFTDGSTGESMFDLERDIEKLDERLARLPATRLLIIDPVSAYMGKIDTHRDAEVRGVLAPLAEVAARRSVAVIGIMHLRKSETSALLRVSGSVGFVAASRCVWGFGQHPDLPGSRIMVGVKNNLAPLGDGLAYSIEAAEDVPHIVWKQGAVRVDPNDVLARDPREKRARGRRRNEAEEWLLALLADGSEMAVSEIIAAANKAAMVWRTVERAKEELRIRAVKHGRRWYWVLA